MTRVKICGITREEDLLACVEAGADMVGFVFADSPRRVTPERAAELIRLVPPLHMSTVGVFVDAPLDEVQRIIEVCPLDYVQLHGSESPDYCRSLGAAAIKAVRVRSAADTARLAAYSVRTFLLDAFDPERAGGTGHTFDHALALDALKFGRIIIAGGLDQANVAGIIRRVRPWGVDVSSGVEKEKGIKDHDLVRSFVRTAKEAL